MPSPYLTEAFRQVVARPLDRDILAALCASRRELRYEELRRAVKRPSPEAFHRGVERLARHALIRRRLSRISGQKRFGSYLSPSPWGRTVADALEGLATKGRIPARLPPGIREQVQAAFRASASLEAQTP